MNETVRRLNEAGTAVWLDDLSRDRLDSGELRRQVEAGLITGVTTNPAILHRAVTTSTAYAGQLAALARLGTAPGDAVRLLACADVLIITALATLGSFLYNIAATLLGGLEVTLASED